MYNINKIVTHSGRFHADETLAVCLVELVYCLPARGYKLVRTFNVGIDDFESPSTIVLDIGRLYDPRLNNYDHHQDANLGCAASIFLESHRELFESAFGRYVYQKVKERLVDPVSKVDLTGSNEGLEALKLVSAKEVPLDVITLIRGLNMCEGSGVSNDDLFQDALSLMRMALKSVIAVAQAEMAAQSSWNKCQFRRDVAIQESRDEFIYDWQSLAEAYENESRDRVRFLVVPSPRVEGHWRLMSADSVKWPIVETGKEVFTHNSKFLAEYANKEGALSSALNQPYFKNKK